jgi:type IV pilus assembly protein PilA
MTTRTIALSFLCLTACGSTGAPGGPVTGPEAPKAAPTERYVAAVEKRVSGDSRGYYDEMLALAHEEPDSRAGRRARATLQGGDVAMMAATVGVLASIAIPNFQRYTARSKQSEAKAGLKALFTSQMAFRAEFDKFCRTFKECDWEAEPTSSYLYFTSLKDVSGGMLLPDRDATLKQARAAMRAAGITPKVDKKGFVFVAVGNIDADEDLDIWTIDNDNNLLNIVDDTR